jgi:hypothetical protein
MDGAGHDDDNDRGVCRLRTSKEPAGPLSLLDDSSILKKTLIVFSVLRLVLIVIMGVLIRK